VVVAVPRKPTIRDLGQELFGGRVKCRKLSPEAKATLDEIYASLIEVRREEVVKPRVGFLGLVKVKQ